MKQLLIVLLLLTGGAAVAGAQSRASLDERLEEYTTATHEKDWEGIMDLIYPKLFDLVPRDQMIQVFENLDGSGMEFNFEKMEIQEISDFYTHEQEVFSKVDYTGKMTILITDESMQEDAMLELMGTSFQAAYGEAAVQLDTANFTFSIDLVKSMFAIADQDSEDWHFLENNAEQEAILDAMIPAAVRERFR